MPTIGVIVSIDIQRAAPEVTRAERIEMNPTTITRGITAYKNLIAVAAMLEAVSPNGATYVVEDVYFDLGQDWMWTTICRRGYRDCQVLCPRDWEKVIFAETIADLAAAVESIRNDRYFGDK